MNWAMIAVAACPVFFALAMLFQKDLYASALCLLAVLLQVAGLFFILGAQLLGLMQVLLYAGAVMVLVVLAVMSTPQRASETWAKIRIPPWLKVSIAVLVCVELAGLARLAARPMPALACASAASGLERGMASLLFTRYALMTESIGILVLVSAISALVVFRQRG